MQIDAEIERIEQRITERVRSGQSALRMYPDDENLPKSLRHVEAVLASWRAADVVRNRRRAIGRGAPQEGDLA